jgi:HNH endonuclease
VSAHPRVWVVLDESGCIVYLNDAPPGDFRSDPVTECVAVPVSDFRNLQADAARLDWLNANTNYCGSALISRTSTALYGESVREAIDAACREHEERFWSKVDKSAADGCWIWTAARKPNGYGELVVQQRRWYAHRYSYQLAFGDIPSGMLVCHRCNNKPCVNPSHLYVGTYSQNMLDAFKDGLIVTPNAKKTACPKCGSDYSPTCYGRGRYCKPCKAKKMRLKRARLRALRDDTKEEG